jgi:ribonuclease Z
MKPSFHARALNGPFDDPGLYVRVLREGRALMFDLGFTTALSARDVLKTTHIFISHAHVDHFIGFDNVLRVCLKRETPLYLYGPEGFIDCVAGKLNSYTWNLIQDYPLSIEAAEVSSNKVKKAVFRAENSFKRENAGCEQFSGTILYDKAVTVNAAILDHQIPCLAFSLEEDYHINIDKSKLNKLNLPVGPWLADLKTAIRKNNINSTFNIGGKAYSFSDVRGIADITKGQKLSYVADVLGSQENINKIVNLVKGSETLYIESYFSHDDRDRAKDRYHLTAREAGRIAKEAEVGRLKVFHFSPKYMDDPQMLVKEAEEAFRV